MSGVLMHTMRRFMRHPPREHPIAGAATISEVLGVYFTDVASDRVLRGGSWQSSVETLRVAARHGAPLSEGGYGTGRFSVCAARGCPCGCPCYLADGSARRQHDRLRRASHLYL